MAFDMDKFKAGVSNFVNETSRKIKQYTPESFSKEKKFVNAIVASLALMTVADRKVETEEVTASLDLINEIDEIRELELSGEAIELFELHIENLTSAIDNSVKFNIAVAKLIGEIAKIKEYPDYPPMIETLLEYVANSDGNLAKEEKEMMDKILSHIK
jgi:tellurite resistance protein